MDCSFLAETGLFRGVEQTSIPALLRCLNARQKTYKKGAIIYRAGDEAPWIGMVLQGRAHVESVDIWGNPGILSHLEPGDLFAETYACLPGEPMLVQVAAAQQTETLFLNGERLLCPCGSGCSYHGRILRNLIEITARKNLDLSRRMLHTSHKTIRGRLLSYFSQQAVTAGKNAFTLPFNRQQLADYLGVDRSALSAALSKMQQEGLIRYKKNRFTLLDMPNP